jgi:HK97 gp10 family phage protein
MDVTLDNTAIERLLAETAREAKRDAALKIAANAQRVAPVDTGNLRRNIEATPDSVVSKAPYSIWVHNGTRNQRAQPFLNIAVDMSRVR